MDGGFGQHSVLKLTVTYDMFVCQGFQIYLPWGSTPVQHSLNRFLNVKAVVAPFKQEKALVGPFFVITNHCVDLCLKLQAPWPPPLSSDGVSPTAARGQRTPVGGDNEECPRRGPLPSRGRLSTAGLHPAPLSPLQHVIHLTSYSYNYNHHSSHTRAGQDGLQRFQITLKALTRAFSWLKVPISALTFKTLCKTGA